MNNLILQIFLATTAAAAICLMLAPLIVKLSQRLKLLDNPDERKVHKFPIPRLGGLGIFVSALAGIMMSNEGLKGIASWPVFYSTLVLLFMIGIWDDLKNINPYLRFIVQCCCATALAVSGIRLTSMYGVFGLTELEPAWQYIVTVFIVVGATNAFNLIDGIDGLATGLALISITVLVYIAYRLRLYPVIILLVSFGGALLGFSRYNSSPASIFMGDGGSLVLGYLISSSGILLIQTAKMQPAIMHPSNVSILVTAILVIPVFDTIRVFIHRLRKGQSPFCADKMHIHHLFLLAGLNHKKTATILCSFSIVLIILAVVLPYQTGVSIAIVAMVILFHIITEILLINQGVEKWLVIIKKMETEGSS